MIFTFCHNFTFDIVLFHTLMMIMGSKHEHNCFLIRLYEINFGFIKLYATTNLPNTYNHVESLWKVRNNNEWVRPESVRLQASECEGMQQGWFQCHWVHRSRVGKDTTADHIATWTRITENQAHSCCPYFQQHYHLWMFPTPNRGPHLLFSVLYQDLLHTTINQVHTIRLTHWKDHGRGLCGRVGRHAGLWGRLRRQPCGRRQQEDAMGERAGEGGWPYHLLDQNCKYNQISINNDSFPA